MGGAMVKEFDILDNNLLCLTPQKGKLFSVPCYPLVLT
ncbi:hypothetical protein RintRC_3347 [Richelia intracellularis]|nr:hypothetical protein RintRC_3347 [Richelia intracellularis]